MLDVGRGTATLLIAAKSHSLGAQISLVISSSLHSLTLSSAIRPQSVNGWHHGQSCRRQAGPTHCLWSVMGQERAIAAVVAPPGKMGQASAALSQTTITLSKGSPR